MDNSFFDLNTEIKDISKTKISLCVITKNEEAFLEGFLENVGKFVDEIIITDTGSTDATLEIAGRHGAKIFHYKWQDDFSAARNFCLNQAGGDWILSLDPDERLAFTDELMLRKLASLPAEENSARVFSFKVLNYYNNDIVTAVHYRDSFFENYRGLFFTRPVHEFLYSSRPGTEIKRRYVKEVEILHYGYTKDISEQKQKEGRNLKILEKAAAENPSDLYNLFYLATNYYDRQLYDKALETIARALEININSGTVEIGLLFNFYRILSSIYLENELFDNLLELSRAVDIAMLRHPEIQLNLGIAAYNKGDYPGALAFFEQSEANNEEKYYPLYLMVNSNISEKILYHKALIYLEQKETEKAVETLLKIDAARFADSLELLEKLLASEESGLVENRLTEYLEMNPGANGIRSLLSNYYMKKGKYSEAIDILRLSSFNKGLILDIAEFAYKNNDNLKVTALCNYYHEKYGENLKLLRLRSQANEKLGKINEAAADLKKAVELARWDKELLERLIGLLEAGAPGEIKTYRERLDKINEVF